MSLKVVHVIYQVSEDGLLKHPKHAWGDTIFNKYGYESLEEALKAIEKSDYGSNLIVVPSVDAVMD